jgi:hypothetical protein
MQPLTNTSILSTILRRTWSLHRHRQVLAQFGMPGNVPGPSYARHALIVETGVLGLVPGTPVVVCRRRLGEKEVQ